MAAEYLCLAAVSRGLYLENWAKFQTIAGTQLLLWRIRQAHNCSHHVFIEIETPVYNRPQMDL